MLSVVFLLIAICAECHKEPFMLNVVMLNVFMLNVFMLNVVLLSAVALP